MNKLSKKTFEPIDTEESDLMKSIESGGWRPVKDIKKQKKIAVEAARNTLKKDLNGSLANKQ
jgi:hypothetical protein